MQTDDPFIDPIDIHLATEGPPLMHEEAMDRVSVAHGVEVDEEDDFDDGSYEAGEYNADDSDSVNHPEYYNTGEIEVIDAIEDWKLGFHLGNVVKYIARSGHKGDELEDLRKARWYLDRYITKAQEKLPDLLDCKGILQAPHWEAVPDPESNGEDGPMWRVRWSQPDDEGKYLWVGHYGGNGPRQNQHMAERDAEQRNNDGKSPTEYAACREAIWPREI